VFIELIQFLGCGSVVQQLSNVGIPFPAPYKKIEKIKDKDSIDI
jgi:hypothetical protein